MPEHTQDVSHHFAAAASAVTLDALSGEAVEAAKKSVFDTIGVALAASGIEPAARAVIALVAEDGGREEATSWGFGRRIPAAGAAFANGALAHCLDFDDHTPWGQHASSSVVPAVLAVAERRGGVSGADLIAAVAAGQDIFARLRCHVTWLKDWNLSSVVGIYGATAAACRVMGLSSTATQHALGIASQQSAGIMEVVAGTGSNLRGMYAGFSARGAVVAALLAEKGLTGADRVFEGDVGVFNAYFRGGYDRDQMLAELGTDFRGAGTLYKVWPSVGTSHSHIQATIGILREHDLKHDDISEIRVHVGDYHNLMCTPLAVRRAPETLVDAKFSLPFLVALAAVHGTVKVGDFTEEGLRNRQVRSLAARVVPVEDSSLDWKLELPPGRVEVITADGRKLSRVGHDFPGGPTTPTTWADLIQKFNSCAEFSAAPFAADDREAVIAMVRDLESLADVAALMERLP